MYRTGAALIVILIQVLAFAGTALADCEGSAMTTAATRVYNTTPTLNTRSGWQFGRYLFTLPPATRVSICSARDIGILFGKKRWYFIRTRTGRYGWVFSGSLSVSRSHSSRAKKSFAAGIGDGFLDISAHAEGNDAQTGLPPGTQKFAIYLIYFLAFVFTIVGIIGKVAYDELGGEGSIKDCFELKKYLRTLIIGPIVFLTFLQAGKFNLGDDVSIVSILVGFCFAFQNGFFWQTVMPGPSSSGAK